ncbi:MAG: flagellar basal body rod protein FlgC [Pseudomonadota bacterium]
MSMLRVFDIAGSGMAAQSVRLNTTASNLANAGDVAGSEEAAYRAKQPVFQAVYDAFGNSPNVPVAVTGITESNAPVRALYQPAHPDADADGNVWVSNVNAVEEMVNMLSASRSYQNNIEVLQTSKDLLLRTLSLGS